VLHQIAALNEALTLAVSLLRVAVGAVRSKRTGAALSFTCCARLEGVPNAWRTRRRARRQEEWQLPPRRDKGND
jgi:hypothetical protein